ncbi:MAG: hypothetical protein QNJ70_24480 [Xenococcaceae cyanobacterium MO_207.B15]|nr:hypothetical protein [Xenococcaceae cyanobacterium MO_207.B15]
MDIKELKKQFTELSGLPATKKNILVAIREKGGLYSTWLKFALEHYPNGKEFTDTRTLCCWLSLVDYLQYLTGYKKPEVSIKVLKDSFTELTNIPANKSAITTECNNHVWLALCVNDTVRHLWHFDTRKKEFWEYLLKRINDTCTFGGNN